MPVATSEKPRELEVTGCTCKLMAVQRALSAPDYFDNSMLTPLQQVLPSTQTYFLCHRVSAIFAFS